MNTPEDDFRSAASVAVRSAMIEKNLKWMKENL
jgi:hypothetical protein